MFQSVVLYTADKGGLIIIFYYSSISPSRSLSSHTTTTPAAPQAATPAAPNRKPASACGTRPTPLCCSGTPACSGPAPAGPDPRQHPPRAYLQIARLPGPPVASSTHGVGRSSKTTAAHATLCGVRARRQVRAPVPVGDRGVVVRLEVLRPRLLPPEVPEARHGPGPDLRDHHRLAHRREFVDWVRSCSLAVFNLLGTQ